MKLKLMIAVMMLWLANAFAFEGCAPKVNQYMHAWQKSEHHSLNLISMDIDDTCLASILPVITTAKHLRYLYLSHNYLGGNGLDALSKALLLHPTLVTLVLDDNHFRGVDMTALAKLIRDNMILKRLDLAHNNLPATTLEPVLVALKKNKHIESVNLYGNKLGNSGIKMCLDVLKVNKSITFMHLGDNAARSAQQALWEATMSGSDVTVAF